jgi:hypothetical protein
MNGSKDHSQTGPLDSPRILKRSTHGVLVYSDDVSMLAELLPVYYLEPLMTPKHRLVQSSSGRHARCNHPSHIPCKNVEIKRQVEKKVPSPERSAADTM